MISDEQIMAELEQATTGLFFMSESDYPFEVVRWEGPSEITPRFLREVTGQSADASVTVESITDFFGGRMAEQQSLGEPGSVELKDYHSLVRLLTDRLDDLRVYRVGKINIPVFIVGRSKTGSWIGLSTRVVET